MHLTSELAEQVEVQSKAFDRSLSIAAKIFVISDFPKSIDHQWKTVLFLKLFLQQHLCLEGLFIKNSSIWLCIVVSNAFAFLMIRVTTAILSISGTFPLFKHRLKTQNSHLTLMTWIYSSWSRCRFNTRIVKAYSAINWTLKSTHSLESPVLGSKSLGYGWGRTWKRKTTYQVLCNNSLIEWLSLKFDLEFSFDFNFELFCILFVICTVTFSSIPNYGVRIKTNYINQIWV